MHTLSPSMVYKDAAQAIEFYKKAFGAKERMRMSAPDGKSIWHAELKIGDSLIFMNDEMPGSISHAVSEERGSPCTLHVYVPKADTFFQRAVDAGAKVVMPMADMFWGDRMGMVVDPFGYPWAISMHVKDMTPKQVRKAGEEFARQMAQQSQQQGQQ